MRTFAAILFVLLLALPSMLAAEPPTYRGRSIAQWSDDLSHPNSVVRVEAAKMLGRLGKHADQAVDSLIAALRDRNPDVRLYAASALGRIKHQPEKCLAALTKLLEDRDEHVRFSAEWSLARFAIDIAKLQHTTQGAEALEVLLATAETSLATSARSLKHLQQIADARKALLSPGGRVAETTSSEQHLTESELLALLADLQADDRLTQLKATDRLGRLGRATELVDAWRTMGDDAFLNWHLTQALIKIGEPAVSVLAQALRDEDELVAQHAIHGLKQMGPTAIGALPQLITIIQDDDVPVDLRESAIWCVDSFGPAAQDAVRALIGILKGDDADPLAEAGARALGSIGPGARIAESTLIEILRSEDQLQQTRIAAAEALPAISSTSDEAVELLVALLGQHDDPSFVAGLASAIGEYGAAAATAVPRLVKLVDATSDFERQTVILAIGNIGPAANQARSRMIECLTEVEEFESVQVAAARALGKLGPDAVIALAGQLEHPHRQVRQTIARALVEIGQRAEPAVKPLQLCLNDRDENPEIRAMVAVALGQIGPAAKSAIPTLIRVLGDERQSVHLRAMATVSIGQIDPGQSPRLIAALNDANPRIRVAAAYALQRLSEPHPSALPMLISELDDDAARGMAMRALSEFKHDSRPLLTDIVNDQTRDEQTRIICLNLISENGLDAAEQLLEALNDETLAESAYWSLRDLGNNSIPFLISAADNEEHFTEDARGTIRELVEELFGGIGGGDGDDVWTGGHALMDGQAAARMATAAPVMTEPTEEPRIAESAMEPDEMLPPEPEPDPESVTGRTQDSDAPTAAATGPTIEPETGFKSV
ncbi:MAG: HEAT repeat domain-containing protein, partial [Pirellulaceae bacterium]|nr:HEAT repeat domain-containing protein [Pirellulaceae bacterium]